MDTYEHIRFKDWSNLGGPIKSIDAACDITEFEQGVEMELRRRGHAAPGEGQRYHDRGNGRVTIQTRPWIITYVGWSATGNDLHRSIDDVADDIEDYL